MFSARQCSHSSILKMVTHALGENWDTGDREVTESPRAQDHRTDWSQREEKQRESWNWGRRNGKLQDRIGNSSSSSSM
jgi:hypothetical protein